MGNARSIREYLGSQRTLMELERAKFVPGELFYTQLVNRGYRTFEQVIDSIRQEKFPEKLFENGFYCNDSIVKMLIDSSEGTKLEETARRMINAREIEVELFDAIRTASAEAGYPLEAQEADIRHGMTQTEVEEKLQRYAEMTILLKEYS